MSAIRYVAAGMVAIAGGWLGMAMAQTDARRVRGLEEMLVAARWLQTHVAIEMMVLPQALERVSQEVGGVIGGVCGAASRALQIGEPPEEAWPAVKPAAMRDVTQADWDLWRSMVVPLGTLPLEGERSHMAACRQRLTLTRGEAEEARRRNERLWRTLGIVGGLAAGLLLI